MGMELSKEYLVGLADMAARNLGELSQEDIQSKLASVLADRMGFTVDAKESLMKGESVRGNEGYMKAMAGRSQPLRELLQQQRTEKVTKEEPKEVKEKLSREEMLEQTIANLKQSALMLMDIMQGVVYDMIDDGEDADAIYDRVMKAYDRNPINADRFFQKEINNLSGERAKAKDPETKAAIENAIIILRTAHGKLQAERGEELMADRANLSRAAKADPKLGMQGAAEALYNQLLSAATTQAFETEVLGKSTDFNQEIMPTLGLVLHMAGKEINQGQGKMEVAQLADTMRLVKNTQGLISAFKVNQDQLRVFIRSWGAKIAPNLEMDTAQKPPTNGSNFKSRL